MIFDGICLITDNVPLLVKLYSEVLKVESEGDDTYVESKTIVRWYKQLLPNSIKFMNKPDKVGNNMKCNL